MQRLSLPGRLCSASALALASAAFGLASGAQAQTAQAQTAAAPAQVEEVVVTGSHLATSAYNSPTPVNVVGEERMKNLAIANVGDALNQLPSFRALTSPATNFFRLQTNIAARTMDLRGLGPQRTLVLVDGRRFVPSNELGTVDLNEIPSSLIGRAEVVTGGASAAYGADAVAGVVNLILDTKFNGFKAEGSYGVSEHGDAQTYNGSFAAGGAFAGGRGHNLFGAEYADEHKIGDCNQRDWCAKYTNYVSNPGWPNNGLPATLVTDNVLFLLNPGGVVPSGPLKGKQFDKAGNLVPFTFGSYLSGTFMVGGDPTVQRAYLIDNQPLRAPDKHHAFLNHTDFDLTDKITASTEFSYAYVKGGPVSSSAAYDFGKSIAIDNAYLTPATRAAMQAAGVTSIPVSRLSEEFGPQAIGMTQDKTYRAVFGLKGELGDDWRWDAYYQYGLTKGRLDIRRIRNVSRWNQAVDAVVGPGGQVVCRSTLTNPANGCIPFDYIGPGNGNVASANWVMMDAWQTRRFTQNVAAANLRGSLFHTWAGPVSAALGVEHREDRYKGDVDPNSRAGLLITQAAVALPPGGQDVNEGYLEVGVPLLKDSPFGKALDVDAAVRRTSYSISGDATTWKLGAVYRLNDEYLVRITRSKDIRAPSAAELSPLSTSVLLPLTDPKTRTSYIMRTFTSGNPNLQLEQANTFTAGLVLQPSWLPRFRLSLDYYDIKMTKAIDTLSAQSTINLCAGGVSQLCPFVIRDANGLITEVHSAYQNLSSLHAKGLELVSDYSIDLAEVASWASGSLAVTVNASYVKDLSSISASGVKTQFANWTGNPGSVSSILGVPRWRADALVTYSADRYSITAHGRYVPSGLLDPSKIGPEQSGYSVALPNSITTNTIDARFYLDLSGRVKVRGDGVELFGGVNNVFDTEPPRDLRLYGNPLYFDPTGRNYKVGVRMKW